ncbi:MAG: thioredoxin-like domain-containing protein [Terrimicrobiaceae bacterium]|nr:thioredoxin-like domain-containing protein [Terrimicrobiaceae bacterium]
MRHFLCLAIAATTVLHAEPRVWTSKDGTATITATFQHADAGRVTLILPNGRSQVVDKSLLSDADLQWIEKNVPATDPSAAGSPAAAASAKIPAALAGKLIDDRGKPHELAADPGPPKYYLFYYSASWCGPCHRFTPDLIQFYRKMKGRNSSFEVILSPSDKTLEDEIAYMKEMRMPWPALPLDQKHAADIPRSNWGYIPAMVLVDADGNRLLQVNDDLSTDDFLKKAEEIFKKTPPAEAL